MANFLILVKIRFWPYFTPSIGNCFADDISKFSLGFLSIRSRINGWWTAVGFTQSDQSGLTILKSRSHIIIDWTRGTLGNFCDHNFGNLKLLGIALCEKSIAIHHPLILVGKNFEIPSAKNADRSCSLVGRIVGSCRLLMLIQRAVVFSKVFVLLNVSFSDYWQTPVRLLIPLVSSTPWKRESYEINAPYFQKIDLLLRIAYSRFTSLWLLVIELKRNRKRSLYDIPMYLRYHLNCQYA